MKTQTRFTSLEHIKSISVIIDNQIVEFKSDLINETPMFFNPIKYLWVPEHVMIGLIQGYESIGCVVIPELKDLHTHNKYEETTNEFVDYDMDLSELVKISSMIVVTEGKDLIGTFSLDKYNGRYNWNYESNAYSKYECNCDQIETMLSAWGNCGYRIAFYDHAMNLI